MSSIAQLVSAHYIHNDTGGINAVAANDNFIHSRPSRSFTKSNEETNVSPKEMT